MQEVEITMSAVMAQGETVSLCLVLESKGSFAQDVDGINAFLAHLTKTLYKNYGDVTDVKQTITYT